MGEKDKTNIWLRKFSLPLCHKGAEKLIRETLGLPPNVRLTDAHVKESAMLSLKTPLRQAVGSCFATAPAILIQREQPALFLKDLYDLLSTGRIKRTFLGHENSVPLNLSPVTHRGVSNPLLRAWEYSLASFAEVKTEFAKWNLYQSLGMASSEAGGIGEVIYAFLNEKLQEANEKVASYQIEATQAADEAKSAEVLLRGAGSENEARRLRADWQARYHHMQACIDLRDKYHHIAEGCSKFFTFLLKEYEQKFPDYFQEVYDPEMAEFTREFYEDSPAGFRLVYKHGRLDATLWTHIRNGEEFVHALADFFLLSESQIAYNCASEEEKNLLVGVTSSVIQHLRSDAFLASALARAQAKKRTPWSYLSGSGMDSLIKTYFCIEKEITQESRWVESPLDLLTFIIETLKSLPPTTANLFEKDRSKGLLMHSPTHAFILHPGWAPFFEAWQDNGFTYTWIRDQFWHSMEAFYQEQNIQGETNASKLYHTLPIVSKSESQAALQKLLAPWTAEVPLLPPSTHTAAELRQIAHEHLTRLGFKDISHALAERAREAGLAPRPLLFADSNWENTYFGFVVSPLTHQIELWRLDPTGLVGEPMSDWDRYLNGSEKKPWVIYTDPSQYTMRIS